MYKAIIIPVLFVTAMTVMILSCGNQANMTDSPSAGQQSATAADSIGNAVTIKELKTRTGKTIIVTESHPQGQSLSNITVGFAGMTGSEMKFTEVDPINKVLIGDLDANGFDEIYIITTSAGSGSYGNVIGLSSGSDNSLSQIFFPPVEEIDLKPGGTFEGYQGHDEYEIKANSLSRTFPVSPAGTTKRSLRYTLNPGTAGYRLTLKNTTAH